MSEVLFHCPLCMGMLSVDSSMAGCQVACPTCQGVFTIPAIETPAPPPSYPPPAPPAESVASLTCPLCSGLFQVMASSQGQQVACPHCGGLIQVPLFQVGESGDLYAPPPPLGNPYEPPLTPPAPAAPAWTPQPLFPSAPAPSSTAPSWQPERRDVQRPIPLHEAPAGSFAPPLSNRPIPTPPAAPHVPLFNPDKSEPTRTTRAEPVALLPTEDGGVVALHDPVKTVGGPGQEIELRQLTPEEKAKRRVTRNIVMVAASLLLMLIVMFVLMRLG